MRQRIGMLILSVMTFSTYHLLHPSEWGLYHWSTPALAGAFLWAISEAFWGVIYFFFIKEGKP